MPFGFLRRRANPPASGGVSQRRSDGSSGAEARGVGFDGLTEEWRIVGRIETDGRLSDALNRREPLPIAAVTWAPIDGSGDLVEAPGLKSIDPYDLIVVLASEDSLPPLSDEERQAHRVHKIPYDVMLELPPFRVLGTIFLFPGSEPDSLLLRATEMFVPVVDAVATLNGRPVSQEGAEVILVNRFYLRGVEQVDRRTGERPPSLPGAPLGGVSWQDRSR